MDHEWSEMNRDMQQLIRKQGTFKEGICALLALRNSIFEQITQIVSAYPAAAFSLMPFPGAQGYHSKTLAYSIWHIFRIEDIVAHELIAGDTQIFFRDNWQHKIGADIITTGNELVGEEIVHFSDSLNVSMLYQYVNAVKESTE